MAGRKEGKYTRNITRVCGRIRRAYYSTTRHQTMSMMSSIATLANLDSLSYQELQAECRQANLSTSGNTGKLKQRLRGFLISHNNKREAEGGDVNPRPAKRNQKSPSDDLICPITHDLPFDPVTAEDGRVYERSAILEHFKSNPTGLKSPVINEPMGRRLFPAVQTKNLIETLIENHAIQGDLAEAWTKKQDERKHFEALTKKANDGDTKAMFKVGMMYFMGKKGVTTDRELAYNWLKKAADKGNIKGLAWVGSILVHGHGVGKNSTLGVAFSAMAAEGGSDLACCDLGIWFADGHHGLPVDTSQAKRFLQKGTSGTCSYVHAGGRRKERALSKLQELCGNEALP
eukprot:scaffold74754_cov41-Attheya_sp.AAC.1